MDEQSLLPQAYELKQAANLVLRKEHLRETRNSLISVAEVKVGWASTTAVGHRVRVGARLALVRANNHRSTSHH